MNKTKRLTRVALLTGLGCILHIAEGMITLPALPGIRLGFANVVGLICLYAEGWQMMFAVNLMRVLFASLLSGSFLSTGFFLSLSGALLSCVVLALAKDRLPLSILGMSVLSAASHGLGQVLMVMFIYKTPAMISYLPILLISAIPTGLFTGYLSHLVLKYLKGGK